MPFDPQGAIENLERSIGVIPAAFLAIVFLAGPTLAWLLYRFVVQPRTRRYTEQGVEFLWLCPACKSANEFRIGRCYRCGLEHAAITGDLQVIDSEGVIAVAPAEVLPPGRAAVPAGGVDPAVAAAAMAVAPVATMRAAASDRPLVAVGPGKPAKTGPAKRTPAGTKAARSASTAGATKATATKRPASTNGPSTANGAAGTSGRRRASTATATRPPAEAAADLPPEVA
jgi:hypothetical protein